MPTYEYRCDSCAKNFDVVQSFHDEPLTACPTCGEPVKKVFGSVGIVFKGSGFYKTDSRGSKAAASTSSSSSSESSSSTDSSSSTSSSDSSTGTGGSTGDAAKKADTKAPAATPST